MRKNRLLLFIFCVLFLSTGCTKVSYTDPPEINPPQQSAITDYRAEGYVGEEPVPLILYYQLKGTPYLVPVTRHIEPSQKRGEAVLSEFVNREAPSGLDNPWYHSKELPRLAFDKNAVSLTLPTKTTELQKKVLVRSFAEFDDVERIVFHEAGTTTEIVPDKILNPLSPKKEGQKPLTLYFADSDVRYLVPVTVFIAPEKYSPREALDLLLAPLPNSSQLRSPFTVAIKLRDYYEKNGVAYVDVETDIMAVGGLNEAAEDMALDALVNTLTQFPTVQGVQILVGGKVIGSLTGHADISAPLTRKRFINVIS